MVSWGWRYPENSGSVKRLNTLKTDFWFARSQWAWLLATCPSNDVRNGSLALAVAEPLLTLAGEKSPRALDIVAAAYAEMGDFSNAVVSIREAIRLAKPLEPHAGQDYIVENLDKRLSLYLDRKPYRE